MNVVKMLLKPFNFIKTYWIFAVLTFWPAGGARLKFIESKKGTGLIRIPQSLIWSEWGLSLVFRTYTGPISRCHVLKRIQSLNWDIWGFSMGTFGCSMIFFSKPSHTKPRHHACKWHQGGFFIVLWRIIIIDWHYSETLQQHFKTASAAVAHKTFLDHFWQKALPKPSERVLLLNIINSGQVRHRSNTQPQAGSPADGNGSHCCGRPTCRVEQSRTNVPICMEKRQYIGNKCLWPKPRKKMFSYIFTLLKALCIVSPELSDR